MENTDRRFNLPAAMLRSDLPCQAKADNNSGDQLWPRQLVIQGALLNSRELVEATLKILYEF